MTLICCVVSGKVVGRLQPLDKDKRANEKRGARMSRSEQGAQTVFGQPVEGRHGQTGVPARDKR